MRNEFKPIALIVVFIMIFAGLSVSAQEWSEEQMEVWKQVETYSELNVNKDFEGFMSYFHPDYLGWYYDDQLPDDKATVKKWVKYSMDNNTTLIIVNKPVGISIIDDVAIVHYVYTSVYSDSEGKKTSAQGRWTDIFKKQDDRWLLIGDHGGPTKE